MKPPITGTIKGTPLAGVRAALVKRQRAGGALVRLLEPRGAYCVGDVVQVGTGEFVCAPVPHTSSPEHGASDSMGNESAGTNDRC